MDTMEKYIGKLLDNRYEILQVIGTGGMAIVYKALCHRLNRLVAVKVLKDEFAQDEEFRNRFHAESQAVAMLSHPNIVAVYDVSRSSSIEYIVMELIDGMTLKQYMERKGTLTWKEALHFVTQILKALHHAHGKGIIHRDIKPHNIMLLRDGTIKVADFGIARFIATQGTLTKEALGSVHYISPEQARGGHIDARADIYSTGVVLYEMITGRLPYEGDTPVSIAIQHINSMPLSPRDIDPDIPEALEKITMKAMCADISKRYASTEEMLRDLEEFRKNPNIQIDYQGLDLSDEVSDGECTKALSARDLKKIESTKSKYKDEEEWDFEEKSKTKRNKAPLIAGVSAILIFIVGVSALMFTLFGAGSGHDTKAPYLVGHPLEEVISNKEFENFRIIEDTQEFSNEYDKGVIISQRPEAGKSIKSNGEIFVVVSQGSKMVTLTDLRNMTEKQARIEVETRLGLELKVEYETSDDVVENYIIRSEPSENSELKVGDTVTVYISKGKNVENVTVPSLIGLSKDQAIREIEKAGLILGAVGEMESARAKGDVAFQSIAPKSEAKAKSVIDIKLSTGQNGTGSNNNPDSNSAQKPDDKADNKPGQNNARPSNPSDTKPNKPANQPDSNQPSVPSNSNQNNKTITVKLPSSPENFTLAVKVNGKTQYSKVHKASDGTANVTISGNGTANVSVYIDDKLFNETTVNFD